VHRLVGQQHQHGGAHVAAPGATVAASPPAPSTPAEAAVLAARAAVQVAPAVVAAPAREVVLASIRTCLAPPFPVHVVVTHGVVLSIDRFVLSWIDHDISIL
jgi:hypothetical protein